LLLGQFARLCRRSGHTFQEIVFDHSTKPAAPSTM
jgi:hypothetical protein